jgi:hypothetical protein
LKVNQARQEEMEINELLDFAENLLLNAAGVWNQSGLEQKQRLQQVLFPSGLTYKDGIYRTPHQSGQVGDRFVCDTAGITSDASRVESDVAVRACRSGSEGRSR